MSFFPPFWALYAPNAAITIYRVKYGLTLRAIGFKAGKNDKTLKIEKYSSNDDKKVMCGDFTLGPHLRAIRPQKSPFWLISPWVVFSIIYVPLLFKSLLRAHKFVVFG